MYTLPSQREFGPPVQAQAEEPLGTDSHQTIFKRVLAPDWAKKKLCIIVPNRWTASPQFFSSVCTRRLLTWSWLFWLMHQRNAGSQETFSLIQTLHFKIPSTQKLKTLCQKYKLELEKWIHISLVSIVIIPTRLLCQMQANSSGVVFLSTISKFTKRRKFCHCLLKFFTKREIRHFHVVVVQWQQRNVQKRVMEDHLQNCCFVLSSYCNFYFLVGPAS